MPMIAKDTLIAGFKQVGLGGGSIALVHSSLSRLGRVEDGADTVIDALLETVGESGTILVPTLTGNETLSPENPPAFDPIHTPCWTGWIPETFRKRANAIRSVHPTHSVSAIGDSAEELTRDHIRSITPCDGFSPYGKIAQRDNSYILLLGVDHNANTTMHYVEEMVGVDYHMQEGFSQATLILGDEIVTRHYLFHRYGTARDFNVMDKVLSERGIQRTSRIGAADVRLIAVKPMVQLVSQYLRVDPRILCRK